MKFISTSKGKIQLHGIFVLYMTCFVTPTLAKNVAPDNRGADQTGNANEPIPRGVLESEGPKNNYRHETTGKGAGANKRSAEDCGGEMDPGQCDPNARYRTADGTCNNLEHPLWGSAGYCQSRLLPPSYKGNSGYRVATDGSKLPPPRILSLNLHRNRNQSSNVWNHLYVFFGQQAAHDIALTPNSQPDGDCCSSDEESDEVCKPILVPQDDPFYSKFGVDCLSFKRTEPCNCNSGPKQISNSISSFIDASFVYGSSEDRMQALRTNDGGQLKTQRSKYGDLLPITDDPQGDGCSFPDKDEYCFRGGENRINQHTTLTCLQTIFMREHNRIARGLAQINPEWDDDKLFQETRRIVGAEMQAIVYGEYLPATLNDKRLSDFNLKLSDQRTEYDPTLNPSVYVEFSTGAFRFGHSMINGFVTSPLNVTQGYTHMKNLYNRPFGLYNGECGLLIESTAENPSQKFDRYMVPDTTEYLRRRPGDDYGSDLAATDINRGRDNGVRPYVDLVLFCSRGQLDIDDFKDLDESGLVDSDNVRDLQDNYNDVRDIDAWTGLLMEKPEDGSAVGPTAACILAIQFHSLKFGDRYYFEHGNEAGSFTDDQLNELRKATLTGVICANTNADHLPKNSMFFSGENNPEINCKDATQVDLSRWKE